MTKNFLPYYISRALLSSLFALFIFGLTWQALLAAIILFGLFLLYLHSGWFQIDPNHPWTPLRRDQRGELIQRKAFIISIIIGWITYFCFAYLFTLAELTTTAGSIAIAVGVLTYFAAQFVLFVKT